MKNTVSLFSFLLCAVLMLKFGFLFGGIASLVTIVAAVLLVNRIEYVMTLNEYAKEYENIYVISNHPKTNEAVVLPEDLDELAVQSSFKDVFNTIDEQRYWLTEAQNPFFVDEKLKEEQKLQIVPIIYKDGQFVNETWSEFRSRVISEIKEDRAKRHAMLKATDDVWYQKHSNNQSGIAWNKKM